MSVSRVFTKNTLMVRKPSEGLSLLHRPTLGLIKEMGGRAIDVNQVFFDKYRVAGEDYTNSILTAGERVRYGC